MKPAAKQPLIAAALLVLAATAQATELRFDGWNAIGGATYGDRVLAPDAAAGYGAAGGATPNIVLDFVANSATPLSLWAGGYASLQNALGHGAFNVPGSVTLTPDAGYEVVLEGFQLGAWSSGSYPDSRIRITDSAGTSFLDTGFFTFQPQVVLSYPVAPIRSPLPLTIWVQDFGDLGMDNLVFSQAAVVPESPTLALLAAGLAVVGGLARRRRALN